MESVTREHDNSKNAAFLPSREDVPPCSPHRVKMVPLHCALMRVGRALKGRVPTRWGNKWDVVSMIWERGTFSLGDRSHW
jgi:hypothetical protein